MTRPSWYLTQTVTFTGRRPQVDAGGHRVTDRYGNEIMTNVDFIVPGCTWEPRVSVASENSMDSAQQVTSGLNVFCDNPDVDVRATDRVTIEGKRYEVRGEVARHRQSRMGNNHAHIIVERVTG
jgi:hypothetical protein